MPMNLKLPDFCSTIAFCVAAVALCTPPCGAQTTTASSKFLAPVPKAALLEYKRKNDAFLLDVESIITAEAAEVRFAKLWVKKVNGIRIRASAQIRERVLESDQKSGTIKSQLEIVRARASLEASGARFEMCSVDSGRIMAWYRQVEPAARDAIRDGGRKLGELLLSRTPLPPTVRGEAGVLIADFMWTWTGNFLKEKGLVPNPDGTFPVGRGDLERLLQRSGVVDRDLLGVVLERDNIEGSRWEATWIHGDGYTDVRCVNTEEVREKAMVPEKVDEDLKRFEAMLRATSMVSAGIILPPASRTLPPGEPWEVDARAFALMLLKGVHFEWLEGSVWLSKAGETVTVEWDDERKNTGKSKFRVLHLATDSSKKEDNRIKGKIKDKGDTVTTFDFVPSGQLTIVDDPAIPSKYVRSANFTGELMAVDERHAGNLFTGVKTTGDVDMKVNFEQIRIAPGK